MNKGKIIQVAGPVVDVEFTPGQLPHIRDALELTLDGSRRVMEAAQHLGKGVVRCIMLSGSEGLCRGMEVTSTGKGIEVPVGQETLGRLFNVLGETIDGGEPVPASVPRRCIHQKPPVLRDQSPVA